jgi:hypothetical protein
MGLDRALGSSPKGLTATLPGMSDTPQNPPSDAPVPESSGGDNRNVLLIVLGAALVGVLIILIIVLINDDDDSSSTSSGDATTTTVASGGETTTTAAGGTPTTLPAGEHQYALSIPAGTVAYSGSCNVEEDTLSAQGQGAQNESISITAQVSAQTGGVSIAALGLEGEGTINVVTVGDGTFQVSGSGSVSDDSADGNFDFTVSGSCTTG